MADSAPGKLPGDLQLTDFDVSLEPGDAAHPLRPVVRGLRMRISASGLQTLLHGLAAEADRRAPIGVRLDNVGISAEGIDLALRMQKGIFGGDLATRLVLSTPTGKELRVELTRVEAPAWVPLDMLLDEAARRGDGAVRRDPGNNRALLLDPARLLAWAGLPARLAPGLWRVQTSGDGLDLAFRENAAQA